MRERALSWMTNVNILKSGFSSYSFYHIKRTQALTHLAYVSLKNTLNKVRRQTADTVRTKYMTGITLGHIGFAADRVKAAQALCAI